MELRPAHLKNESAVQHTERHIFLRRGNETQEALRQQSPHMVHEQQQLVAEVEAQVNLVRHQMKPEQRTSLRTFESVSQESDVACKVAQHLRGDNHRSEKAALFPGEKS